MADEPLRDDVLHRAREDGQLSESARSALSAAWPPDAPLAVALDRLDAEVGLLNRLAAVALTAPSVDDVESACVAFRSAAARQTLAERAADTLSADRVQFLETSLEFHARHGAQPCPVCAAGSLDDDWVARARAALAAEKDAASALRVARSATHRARQAVTALVRAVDPPPAEDGSEPAVVAARVAYQSLSTLPADDDMALADRVAQAMAEVRGAYDALGEAVGTKLQTARGAQQWLWAVASTLDR